MHGGASALGVTPASLLPATERVPSWAYVEVEPLPDEHELHRARLAPEPVHDHGLAPELVLAAKAERYAAKHPDHVRVQRERVRQWCNDGSVLTPSTPVLPLLDDDEWWWQYLPDLPDDRKAERDAEQVEREAYDRWAIEHQAELLADAKREAFGR